MSGVSDKREGNQCYFYFLVLRTADVHCASNPIKFNEKNQAGNLILHYNLIRMQLG